MYLKAYFPLKLILGSEVIFVLYQKRTVRTLLDI